MAGEDLRNAIYHYERSHQELREAQEQLRKAREQFVRAEIELRWAEADVKAKQKYVAGAESQLQVTSPTKEEPAHAD